MAVLFLTTKPGEMRAFYTGDNTDKRSIGKEPGNSGSRSTDKEARGLLRQAGERPAATLEANATSGRMLKTQGEEEYNIGYFRPIETGGKRSKRVLFAQRALDLAEFELAQHIPYCPVCWDKIPRQLIHLNEGATKGVYGCRVEGSSYWTAEFRAF